jgi:hypothetical protein
MRFQSAALLAALALVPVCAKHLKLPNKCPDISLPPLLPLQSLTYPFAIGGGKFTYSVRTGGGVTCAKMYGMIQMQDVTIDSNGGILCSRGLPFHKIREYFSLYPVLTPSPSLTPLSHHHCHCLHCCVAAAVIVHHCCRTAVVFHCHHLPGLQNASRGIWQ